MRRKASLLRSHGHPDAGLYPLGMLNDEAELVIEQENNRVATEATMIHAAAGALFSEEGGRHFTDLIRGLGAD